jgi:hypothetical protein
MVTVSKHLTFAPAVSLFMALALGGCAASLGEDYIAGQQKQWLEKAYRVGFYSY